MISHKMIVSIANDLRFRFRITPPILEIDKFVTRCGGRVEPSKNMDYFNDPIIYKAGSTFILYTPDRTKNPEQLPTAKYNYMVALSLGKLYLYMGYHYNKTLWNSFANNSQFRITENGDKIIHDANVFAANLLLPEEYFTQLLATYTGETEINFDGMANEAKVTLKLIRQRGQELGYHFD